MRTVEELMSEDSDQVKVTIRCKKCGKRTFIKKQYCDYCKVKL